MVKVAESRTVSEILRGIYVRGAQWSATTLNCGTGVKFPTGKNVAVHFVLRGEPTLRLKSQPEIPLQPGDAMIVLDGTSHCVTNGSQVHLSPFFLEKGAWPNDRATQSEVKSSQSDAREAPALVLSGVLRVSWPWELSERQLALAVLHGNRSYRREPAAARTAMDALARMATKPGGVQCITLYARLLIARELQDLIDRSPGLFLPMNGGSIHVRRALEAIVEDPGLNWSVAALAKHVGMSRSTFAAAFNKQVGIPPMALLHQHRMELAAQLLKRPHRIKEISLQVGYNSLAAFTRAFTSHFNLTPSAYRKLDDQSVVEELTLFDLIF